MLLLRWLIGIGCVVALAAFALILVVGGGIRSAYQSGAGVQNLLRDLAVWAIPILLAAMLGSVFVPHARGYLHVVAVGVGLAIAGCATLLGSHPGEGIMYMSFFASWGLYYYLTLWGTR